MQNETTYVAKDGILEIKRLIITVAKHIMCLILGFFMASAKGQLSPSPFGLSLVAGLPVNYSYFAPILLINYITLIIPYYLIFSKHNKKMPNKGIFKFLLFFILK